MATEFSSPILDNETIAGYFNAFDGVQIKDSDLDKPLPEFVQRLYQLAFFDITDFSIEKLRSGQSAMVEDLEYPELYDSSDYLKHFLLGMVWVAKKCNVDDFTISDLLNPKPKRTKYILSLLINFAFFKTERSKVYEQMKRERECNRELEESILKENQDLQRKINTIKAARAEQEPECEMLNEEYKEMEAKMNEFHKLSSQSGIETKEMEAKLSEQQVLLSQTKVKIATLAEECDHLSRQIVQSPERVMKDEQRKKKQLQQLRDIHKDLDLALMEIKKLSHQREQLLESCEPLTASVNNLHEKFLKNNEIVRDVSKLHEASENLKQENASITRKINQQKEIIKNKEERISKLQIQFKLKKQSMQDTIDQLCQTLDNRNEQQCKAQETDKNLKQEINLVEKKIREQEYEFNENEEVFKAKYANLLEQIDSYHNRLGSQIEHFLGLMQ